METYSQHPISKSDVAEFDFDEVKDKGIADISGLNLKNNADNIKLKIEQSWSKAEVSSLVNKAVILSNENTKKDKEEEERIEQEKKKADEANKRKAEEAKKEAERVEGGSKENQGNSQSVGSQRQGSYISGTKAFRADQAKEAFEQIVIDLGVSDSEKAIWSDIITRESGWNVYATNPSSGAYGLPQSLPGNKMASIGDDYLTNPYTQLMWMHKYVHERYGSFAGVNWYSRGWY